MDIVKDLRQNEIVPFVNLNQLKDEEIKNQLALYIPYFMKEYEQQLCQGNDSVSCGRLQHHIPHSTALDTIPLTALFLL